MRGDVAGVKVIHGQTDLNRLLFVHGSDKLPPVPSSTQFGYLGPDCDSISKKKHGYRVAHSFVDHDPAPTSRQGDQNAHLSNQLFARRVDADDGKTRIVR